MNMAGDDTLMPDDDEALFNAVSGDEPPVKQEVKPEAAPAVVPSSAEPKVETPAAEPAKERQEPELHRVPLRELLDEREKRQKIEREAEELRRYKAEQERIAQRPAERVDPFANPDGFVDSIEGRFNTFQQELEARDARIMAQIAERDTIREYGKDKIDTELAYLGKLKERDPAVEFEIRAIVQRDPVDGLRNVMRYAAQRRQLEEVGPDIGAYKQRLLEESLNDPAFLAKAIEKAKSSAAVTTTANVRPAPAQLPSVNRSTAAASNASEAAEWESDGELLRSALRRQR